MTRRKKPRLERPLINVILILFFGLAMHDSGGMAIRTFSDNMLHAILSSFYFLGALAAFISLLMNKRAVWLWILITVLLCGGLTYLVTLNAITWIIGITTLLFFWLNSHNRNWHKLRG